MNIRYRVELADDERNTLLELTRKGQDGVRRIRRAHTLLMADAHAHTDGQIAKALSTSASSVYRTRKRFVEGGLQHALDEDKRPGGSRLLTALQEASLVAIACSPPPKGRAKWTLQLLADRLVVLTDVAQVSASTIGRRLRDNELKPWQKRMWCIPEFDADYVAAMESVLELYAEPADPQRPLVCFDETFKQLVEETRAPLPAKKGATARFDYEYKRAGTANLFVFLAPWQGWRHIKPTQHKGNVDFAHCMRDLVDQHFPDAQVIRVVLDNLSTHRPGALYKAFDAPEARRILQKLEFHYTPKHGSWLNMAECEIGILDRQCLDRRIPSMEALQDEVQAWQSERNDQKATIEWMFDVAAARKKLQRAYPELTPATTAEAA
jgi:transposase